MRYSKSVPLCGFKERPDAACRNRPRCSRCGRALSFTDRGMCKACRNIRDLARSRFPSMVASHIAGDVTGAGALASGLNAARVGALAGLSDKAILSALLPAVPRLARDEFREDLKAALAGIRALEGGKQ